MISDPKLRPPGSRPGPLSGPAPHATGGGSWLALLGVVALLWFFWSSWLVFPFKILVVLFHELSHALAAIATGGSVLSIELVPQEGGLARTAGGSRFLVLSAGYLGSLLWGGMILLAAAKSRLDRAVTTVLAAIVLGAALLWVRPFWSFGFAFTAAAGLALLVVSRKLGHVTNDFLLRLVGLVSLFYALFDIQSDVLARPNLCASDASQLARLTGLPTLFWGILWMLAGLAAAWFFLRKAASYPNQSETGAESGGV
ncbi:MAG TPA: M50 family metallopeptidase [Thermoanaerobaculia bacterium]|nr:M50 family metallopeptidase [Thermoanaerobaculia bacterium]